VKGENPSDVVTTLLNDHDEASRRAHRLLPLVYEQLRAAAQQRMATERAGHTLGATALVHEAYVKLIGPREVPWQNRAHFYAAAAEAMRQILLDHAKARGRLKRRGDDARVRLSLDEVATLAGPSEEANEDQADFVALDAAMCRLERRDPRVAEVVRLKYYAGLEIAQVSLILGVSERTVKNDWAFAKAWLERELRSPPGLTEG
jgi:RNA polymerase sigma factor (TIGR02999 family)